MKYRSSYTFVTVSLIMLFMIFFISLAAGCSTQRRPITIVSSTDDIKRLVEEYPVIAPKERSYAEFSRVINVAMFRECVLRDYFKLPPRPYCVK